MKFLFSAGVVPYFKRKDKIEYLLLKHTSSGHWDFPKGKIEKDETKLMAAERELFEEASVRVKIHEGFERSFEYFFQDYDGQLAKKKVYFFVGKSSSKHAEVSKEHVDFAWLDYEEAIDRLTYDNAKDLLTDVNNFLIKHGENTN